ncbi:MAG: hypothetical protein ACYTGH_05055 [Planctomycetota bacterium]
MLRGRIVTGFLGAVLIVGIEAYAGGGCGGGSGEAGRAAAEKSIETSPRGFKPAQTKGVLAEYGKGNEYTGAPGQESWEKGYKEFSLVKVSSETEAKVSPGREYAKKMKKLSKQEEKAVEQVVGKYKKLQAAKAEFLALRAKLGALKDTLESVDQLADSYRSKINRSADKAIASAEKGKEIGKENIKGIAVTIATAGAGKIKKLEKAVEAFEKYQEVSGYVDTAKSAKNDEAVEFVGRTVIGLVPVASELVGLMEQTIELGVAVDEVKYAERCQNALKSLMVKAAPLREEQGRTLAALNENLAKHKSLYQNQASIVSNFQMAKDMGMLK